MSNTFGIKQSFRSQAIARKFARNSSPSNNTNENSSQQTSEINVFENGNSSFASDVLNRKSGGNVGNVKISSNTNSYNNNQHSLVNVSQDDSDKPVIRKLVNARLLHMKNYNKAVTRSADHM